MILTFNFITYPSILTRERSTAAYATTSLLLATLLYHPPLKLRVACRHFTKYLSMRHPAFCKKRRVSPEALAKGDITHSFSEGSAVSVHGLAPIHCRRRNA